MRRFTIVVLFMVLVLTAAIVATAVFGLTPVDRLLGRPDGARGALIAVLVASIALLAGAHLSVGKRYMVATLLIVAMIGVQVPALLSQLPNSFIPATLVPTTDNYFNLGAAGTAQGGNYRWKSLFLASAIISGATNPPAVNAGEILLNSVPAGTTTAAPGAGYAKLYFRKGTNAGTCKLVMIAGNSTTETTITDNVSGGGAGCN